MEENRRKCRGKSSDFFASCGIGTKEVKYPENMPKFSKTDMRDLISQALLRSGFTIQSVDGSHPFLYTVNLNGTEERLLVYVWNITHGGKNRAEDEFRIQITGVGGLKHEAGTKTLLLGVSLEPASEIMLVGFDSTKHATFGSSPSIQVHTPTFLRAQKDGMAAETKELPSGDSEVVFVFRLEHFADYLRSVFPAYHQTLTPVSGGEAKQINKFDFAKASVTEADLSASVPQERKKALVTAAAWVRDQKFRTNVLHVYGYKCAFCGLQASLVEAAHIDGVAKKGTDEVQNGIALCPTHHGAFDRGLLAVREDLVIVKNIKMDTALRKAGLDGGLDTFYITARVGKQIYLPNDAKYNPSSDYLKKNLEHKGMVDFSA